MLNPTPQSFRPGDGARVLVVDDHAGVRRGLRSLIQSSDLGVAEVETAATVAEATVMARVLKPTLSLLDVDMNGEDGLDLVKLLARHGPVVVISSHVDSALERRALGLGAVAVISKLEPAPCLVKLLRDVMSQPATVAGAL
jgi:DNA-binding NarL/FixJ family response regulator